MKSEYSGNKRFGGSRSKRNLFKLLSYTVIFILLIEISRIFLGFWLAKPVIAQWGVIEKGCWVESLFLRDEALINSEIEGGLTQKVDSGARVSKGTVVAWINTGFGLGGDPDDTALRLERKLVSLLSEDKALAIELNRVNNEIAFRRSNSKKFPLKASEIKEDLGSLEQEKGQILRNIKGVREKIIKTRVSIKGQMRGFKSVVAPEVGYLFFQYDNWEGRLTPDHFFELSEEDFRNNFPLKSAGARAKPGATLGKIISPFNQIVAIMADTAITGKLALGDSWWFKTSDSLHSVTIRKIIPLSNGKTILAFEDPGISQQYMPNRRGKIFAIYKKVTGVTVSAQALYRSEGKVFVKIPKGDGYTFQEVQVLESDGDKAVIEGIEFGTTIMSR